MLRKHQGGFTLLEMLVYIGLFSLIMVGALIGAFQIINSSVETRQRVVLEQEAHFLFRKTDWALNGDVDSVSAPGNDRLEIDKGGNDFDFWVDNGLLVLNDVSTPLSSSGVEVSDFYVENDFGPPESVSASFKINGRQFATTTRYVR